MSEISKQALKVDNSQSFPDNNSGQITPSDLRAFNVNIIDSLVDEITYNVDSASWNNSVSALNQFSASQQPSFTALNDFTASQLDINTGVNLFTQSATGRLDALENDTANLELFTSSINQIIVNGNVIGTSTRLFFNGFVSASIVQNVDGPIASITVLADQTFASSASFNAYTASTNAWTASAKVSIGALNTNSASLNTSVANLNTFSSSALNSIGSLNAFTAALDATYATDAQLNYSSSVLQANIDTKLNTSSFDTFSSSVYNTFSSSQTQADGYNSYTASNDSKWNAIGLLTGSYATTGSNTFIGNQTISGSFTTSGSFTLTGSVYSNVIAASIVSSTASIDLSKGNFFTLTLPSSSTTRIDVQNVSAGQTALIEINTVGTLATASFSTNVFQPSASFYVPTNAAGTDILTLSSFASNKVYLVSVKTMTNI